MTLGSLLVPTLVGYWLLTRIYFTRYRMLRDSGYHVLFKSAIAGCSLVVVSRLLIVFFLGPEFPTIVETWKSYVPSSYSGTIALSAILAVALPPLANQVCNKRKAAERAAVESGDFIELLINEAIENCKHIELSLKSGKSYIGFPYESGITRLGESDVSLIPIASGYRNEDTRELTITTNYAPAIASLVGEEDTAESTKQVFEYFRIVIPLSEIVSARQFDLELYEQFQWETKDPEP